MEEQKKEEIIVNGQVQNNEGANSGTQTQSTHTERTETKIIEKKSWSFAGLGLKKWIIIAIVVIVVCFLLSMVFRVNLPRAQQIAQQAAGGQAQIIAQEIDTEFLFFNEYSFELVTADGAYCEVELDAFGNVTSMEYEGWRG